MGEHLLAAAAYPHASQRCEVAADQVAEAPLPPAVLVPVAGLRQCCSTAQPNGSIVYLVMTVNLRTQLVLDMLESVAPAHVEEPDQWEPAGC